MHIKLSVVIITFNEEKNIERCLKSVIDLADDILVLDSNSTDQTRNIALKYGARVIEQSFLGYVAQKNKANDLGKYDYILSLDADEVLSEQLKNSIQEIKNNWQMDGYELKRLTNYCGHWVRYSGWYPDKKIRLFDRNKAKWIGESLHEKLVLNSGSKKGNLNGDLLHYSYFSISDHLKQIDKFTDIQAKTLVESNQKPNFYHFFIKPIFKFFRDYVVKLGFLDGIYGFNIAKYSALATYTKYMKAHLIFKQNKNE